MQNKSRPAHRGGADFESRPFEAALSFLEPEMPKLTGLLREIFPSAREYRDWLLRPLLIYSSHLKGHIMSVLDDVNSKLDALQASADAANTKADALIAANKASSAQVTELQAQIATLQAAGAASPDDLAALGAKADAIKASLDTQSAEDDAALAPAAAPAPADGGDAAAAPAAS